MRVSRSRNVAAIAMIALIILSLVSPAAVVAAGSPQKASPPKGEPVVFFAADGMLQNKVADYAAQGSLPQLGGLLKKGGAL